MVWLGLFLSGLVALPGLVWFLAGLVIWPDQVSLYAYVHLQTYMYVAMHFYVCICLYVCAHPCTCVDLFVYLHVYLFVFAQETRPERERERWSSGGLAPGRKLGSHSHRLARRGGLWLQGAHGSQALAGMGPTGRRCGSRARRFHWDTFMRRAALCTQGRKL